MEGVLTVLIGNLVMSKIDHIDTELNEEAEQKYVKFYFTDNAILQLFCNFFIDTATVMSLQIYRHFLVLRTVHFRGFF